MVLDSCRADLAETQRQHAYFLELGTKMKCVNCGNRVLFFSEALNHHAHSLMARSDAELYAAAEMRGKALRELKYGNI